MSKLIFVSHGLNTSLGREIIGKELKKDKDIPLKTILLVSVPGYEIDEILIKACKALGFAEENIVLSSGLKKGVHFDYCYVTEGQTFEVVDYMRKNGLFEIVQDAVRDGAVYIGASAGAIIAGSDWALASDFDSNYLGITDFTGLKLYDGIILPHYEPDERERYIQNTESYRIERYKKIYSVGNEDIFILEE